MSLLRGLVTPRTAGDRPWSIAAALVLLFAFCLFGAPLAYVATLGVVWPVSRVLGRWARPWWPLMLISGVTGAALLPIYLKMLTPRGSWNFGSGIGFIAGAASGWAFWYLALPDRGDVSEHAASEQHDTGV